MASAGHWLPAPADRPTPPSPVICVYCGLETDDGTDEHESCLEESLEASVT